VVPCQSDMARPGVADGGDGIQVWSLAAYILNNQLRIAIKGGSPA